MPINNNRADLILTYLCMRRVVVTGMGAVTPLGNSLEASWNAVLNGQSGI